MPIHSDFISDILARFEGVMREGYVPCQRKNFFGRGNAADFGSPLGASGVTIGAGLDLGQQDDASLERMGLAGELRTLFRPYIGKKRVAAMRALAAAPLSISEEQCAALNRAVHADYIRRAAALYDRHAEQPFAAIPPQAQAVLTSLFYQLGSPFPSGGHPGYPTVFAHLCRADWQAAVHELRTGFRRYASRRRREGDILAEVL